MHYRDELNIDGGNHVFACFKTKNFHPCLPITLSLFVTETGLLQFCYLIINNEYDK